MTLQQKIRDEFYKHFRFDTNDPERGGNIDTFLDKIPALVIEEAEKLGIIFGEREGDAFKEMSREEILQALSTLK